VCGGTGGQFGPGSDVQLGEDVGQVHLDGAGGEEQPPGDGLVPQALAGQADDLQLRGGPASGSAPPSAQDNAARMLACSAASRSDQPVRSAPGRAASADRATSSAHSSSRWPSLADG
jgi:hypothetical protein